MAFALVPWCATPTWPIISLIQKQYPVLSEALLAGASAQLRNMASTGGNLLQRTRCMYFRDTVWACNKRAPGSGCSAIQGSNRTLAILGTSEHCIATNPSDMNVALAALEAKIHVTGKAGTRVIPISEFFLKPGTTPQRETVLDTGDLITHVTLPPPTPGSRSRYLKLRDRASYEFALASAAIVAVVEDGKLSYVRIALGGVGTIPWRAIEAEAMLLGEAPTKDNFRRAAEAVLHHAKAQTQNSFKIELASRCITHALSLATLPRMRGSMSTAEQPNSVIGKPQRRIDGPLKVSGRAMYTSDHNFPGMLYAVPVGATIAKGRILELETARAEGMPGVCMVYHHANIGKLYQTAPDPTYTAYMDEQRPPFRDEESTTTDSMLRWPLRDTLEHATSAADAIEVVYHSELPSLDPRLLATTSLEAGSHRGDPQSVFASAPAQIDHVYVTPVETHAAIELHATVAVWNGKSVTLYDTVQGICNHQNVMTQMLGVEKEDLRVIMKYLGSGFGGKTGAWTHCCLAAVAARDLNRPVKLVITRKQAFEAAGHRPRTEQRLRLGAAPDGKLLSLQHDYSNTTSMLDTFVENCGEATPYLYSTPNLGICSGVVKRTVGAPTWMRGPGAVPGSVCA